MFLNETIRELRITKGGKYIDATFGEGGHANAIHAEGGEVLGIEADENQHRKHIDGSIPVVLGNFKNIVQIAKENDFYPVKGIVFDLGLSMEQLNLSRRGFSFKKPEEPLDMRIGDTEVTASEILQRTNLEDLSMILVKYSEDQMAESIAKAIIATRSRNPMDTVADLTEIIRKTLEHKGITSEQTIGKTYARIFQALRIYVNDEFDSLRQALSGSIELLETGGRLVIISFHSLEDRIVKLFARQHASEMKHVRVEVDDERSLQKFERSAQLRVLEKIS